MAAQQPRRGHKAIRKKGAGSRALARRKPAKGKPAPQPQQRRGPAPPARRVEPPPPPPPGPVARPKAGPAEPASPVRRTIAHGPGLQARVGRQLLYISRAQIQKLPWEPDEALNHVQIALRELGRGKVERPTQVSLYPQRESLLTAMPAYVPNVQACGVKWLGSFPNNHRLGLPQVSAVVVLSDPHTGFPLAMMDAMWLTAQRGPAVSAVAARLLARAESEVAGIIGGGVQGRGHIPALIHALPKLQHIRIYDVRHAQAVKAAKGWRGQLGRRVKLEPVDSADKAVRGADVVVSATAITHEPEPMVSMEWIKGGALILPLDLDAVFEPDVFEKADRFYVDSLDDLKILHERGLFIKAMPANITGQLGQLVAGRIPGRSADAERIVCLSTGVGCVDVVLARAIYEKACRLGIGQLLEL